MTADKQHLGSIVFKTILTAVALWLLLSIVEAVWVRNELAKTAAGGMIPIDVRSRAEDLIEASERPERRPWPLYPGARPSGLGVRTVNGVRVVGESWETTASASEILDYYRRQMGGRGWSDSTEETFSLDPESQRVRGGDLALQNEIYLTAYRETMESALTMRRGKSSFMLTLEPGSVRWKRKVRVHIASTPSLRGFAEDIAADMMAGHAGTADRQIVEAEERIGNSLYRTTISSSLDEPRTYFKSSLASLKSDGWSEVFVGPDEREGPEHFAVLQKGNEYLYLTVTRNMEEKKSTRLLTRVSE